MRNFRDPHIHWYTIDRLYALCPIYLLEQVRLSFTLHKFDVLILFRALTMAIVLSHPTTGYPTVLLTRAREVRR